MATVGVEGLKFKSQLCLCTADSATGVTPGPAFAAKAARIKNLVTTTCQISYKLLAVLLLLLLLLFFTFDSKDLKG